MHCQYKCCAVLCPDQPCLAQNVKHNLSGFSLQDKSKSCLAATAVAVRCVERMTLLIQRLCYGLPACKLRCGAADW